MHLADIEFARRTRRRTFARIGSVCVLTLGLLAPPAFAARASKTPTRIAVFAFELDDESPAAALLNQATSTAAAMEKVNSDARAELAQSGRYDVIDASKTDMSTVANRSFKSCDGCEAGIALKLGAQQSLIGIVKRATQTDYYIVIQIRDARSGKVLVVDGGGSLRCALMGDLIARSAVDNGWEGVVIYGCIRDRVALRALALGIKALASIPRKSERRGEGQLQLPIEIAAVACRPGDRLVADEDGVVIFDST